MTTLTDYAQISGRVYQRTQNNRMYVPNGFTEVQWLRDDTITGFSAGVYKKGNVLIFGGPIDPFFHLPVWLQADFSGQTLWAYNLEHLEFLAEHVGAKLRERNTSPRMSRSIGARLPRWMTAASNREAVLKAIEKLKGK